MGIDILRAKISEGQRKYLSKDNYKSLNATCILVTPGSTGASGEYLRIWQESGGRTQPICGDVCFISSNGRRKGAKDPPFEQIKQAAEMGCSFLTDARCRRPEGGNFYNLGEQKVADYLRSLGFSETEEFGGLVARWK